MNPLQFGKYVDCRQTNVNALQFDKGIKWNEKTLYKKRKTSCGTKNRKNLNEKRCVNLFFLHFFYSISVILCCKNPHINTKELLLLNHIKKNYKG